MQILTKRSFIQIEFTSDEVEALKFILNHYNKEDYQQFAGELLDLIK